MRPVFAGDPMTRTFRTLLAAALAAALALPAGVAMAGTQETRLLEMVNAVRGREGKQPLAESRRLSVRAERNSRAMARSKELSHSGTLRSGMAENVGVGPTLRSVVRAWWRSDPHRRNMLGAYDLAGVGVDKAAGLFWVTLIVR